MNTKMNKPFELKVIVAFEEVWDGGACEECAFHYVGTCSHYVGTCSHYDCKGGVFKLIGVVEERKEEE